MLKAVLPGRECDSFCGDIHSIIVPKYKSKCGDFIRDSHFQGFPVETGPTLESILFEVGFIRDL
jgi:hypothetical protein